MWSYLRNKVRESFLAGVNDALAELESGSPADTLPAVTALRQRLLPAPDPEAMSPEPARRRGANKGE